MPDPTNSDNNQSNPQPPTDQTIPTANVNNTPQVISDDPLNMTKADTKPPSVVSTPVNTGEPPPPESVVTSPHVPQKYGGKKVMATIFGVILLIGAVSVGVYLVQRQQELREQAASGSECSHSADCILLDNPGNKGEYHAPRTIVSAKITDQDIHDYGPGQTDDNCRKVVISGTFISWEKYGTGSECKDVSNVQIWMGTEVQPTSTPVPTQEPTTQPTLPPGVSPTKTPTTTPTAIPTNVPGVTATCSEVKAYDTSWNLLATNDLKALSVGDKVRFAVSGTASSGSFDKARFIINSSTPHEVTTKKPGTQEFYYEYTVPTGTTSFNVKGELHHSSLGWF